MNKKRYGTKGQYIGILQAIWEFNNGAKNIWNGTPMIEDYIWVLHSLNIEAAEKSKIALRKLLKQLYKWENVENFLADDSMGFKVCDYTLWHAREWQQIDHNLLIGRILDKYKVEPEEVDRALGFRLGQTKKWLVFNNLLWDENLLEALKEGVKSISFSSFVVKVNKILKEKNV